MGAREDALKRIAKLNAQLAKHDEQRKELAQERDEQMRIAVADRATWAEIQATGVSKATIAKAVGGK
jgi:hypothetical protein